MTRSLFVLLLGLCCYSTAFAVQIEGKIYNYDNNNITINVLFGRFHWPVDDIKILLTQKGEFSIQLDVKEIRFAELTIGSKKIHLLLNPAYDKTIIEVDYKGAENTLLLFKGGAHTENKFINERPFTQYFTKLNTLSPSAVKDLLLVDQFCATEAAKDLQELLDIQSYMDRESFEALKAEVEHYYLNMRIYAGIQVGYRSLQQYEMSWMERNDSLSTLVNCTFRYKFLPNYNSLIELVFAHLERKFNVTGERDSSMWLKKFEVTNTEELFEILAKDNYNKPHYVIGKDQMCAEIFEKSLATRIHRAQAEGDFENLVWLFEKFKILYPNSPYLAVIEPRMEPVIQFEMNKNKDFPNITFYPVDTSIQSLNAILERPEFKGKVVLIDIWGTWCGPCREEFPYLKDLKAKLKKEPVEYLYLANEKTIRNPESHWKEVAKYYNLTGYHYLLNEAVLKDFWSIVNNKKGIQTYPSYMIINKKGEVAIPVAAIPSDGDALYQQIIKSVKE